MQLSRIGQGLATSAVSALLVTGLAVTSPAHAAEGAGVRLLSQQDGIASVKQDSDGIFFIPSLGHTVTLTAEQLDPSATISFEYNADPAADDSAAGWTMAMAEFSNPQAPFVSVEWVPDTALVGTTIAIRAVASTPADGETPGTTTYSRRNNVLLSNEAEAVKIGAGFSPFTNPNIGPYFEQPYADSGRTASLLAVSGTTSATDGTVGLSVWNPGAAQFQGHVDAAVTPYDLKIINPFGTPVSVPGGYFQRALDINAYDVGDGDALAVRAERESDEVLPVRLARQEIRSISASAPATGAPFDNAIDVSVADQAMRPVVGAEVRRASDGALVGYTDVSGVVTAQQASGTSETYYVNTTDVDAFEEDVDFATGQIDVPAYVPVATATVAELADGDVFDDQEYAEGDIALQVVDGRGDAFASEQEITYSLTAPGDEPAEPVTVMTDEDGRFAVPFDPADKDGEYTLAFTAPDSAGGDDEEPVTFTAGDAVLTLSPLAGTAASGGRITYGGSLTVEGEALTERGIDLAYTRGTEQAPGTGADAGLGEGRALTGATSTDEKGGFTVTVADVVETGSPAETGGTLQVTARGLGDTVRATADFTAVVVPPTTPPTPTPPSGKGRIELRLTGSDARDGSDKLRVRGPESAAGLRVRIHVRTPGGFWRVLKATDLDKSGDASLKVADLNGGKATQYRVRLIPNPLFKAFTSKVLRLK